MVIVLDGVKSYLTLHWIKNGLTYLILSETESWVTKSFMLRSPEASLKHNIYFFGFENQMA